MDKELKRLVVEIISLTLLLLIVVPICANASSNYQAQKEALLVGDNTIVDISNKGEYKEINIYNESDIPIKAKLILKISKFSDDYLIHLDEQIYDIRDLEYTEDTDYQYYNLGIYEIEEVRTFKFKLQVKNKNYYDETISYSFYTEGLL